MFSFLRSTAFTAGLAIFSMLFGAGNLMYPIKAGLDSGVHFVWGIAGFVLTAVFLPVLGLMSIIYFNGDYRKFFNRLGKIPGTFIIAFSMATIGPLYVMSRIVNVCYEMLKPFMPSAVSGFAFAVIFCLLTFFATCKESRVVDLLGRIISPIKLISLTVVLIQGVLNPQPLAPVAQTVWQVFVRQAVLGYALLDLLGAIFFGSIVLSILKANMSHQKNYDVKSLTKVGLQAGLIGCVLLGLVYIGMGLLGAFHGQGLESANIANLFSLISFKVLGSHGALIIATAVAMSCFSTIIALSAVLAEYVQKELCHNRVSYVHSLIGVLVLTLVVSASGLNNLLYYADPLITTLYPIFITLTLCNLAYSTLDFKPVKLPVLATLALSIYLNWPSYAIYAQLFC